MAATMKRAAFAGNSNSIAIELPPGPLSGLVFVGSPPVLKAIGTNHVVVVKRSDSLPDDVSAEAAALLTTSTTEETAACGASPLNWFAQTLRIPSHHNVEYTYIANSTDLQDLLHQFHRLQDRTLVVRKEMLVGGSSLSARQQVTLTLPPSVPFQQVGMDLDGFPPVVVHIDNKSPLRGTVPNGYVLDKVLFLERRDTDRDVKELSLATGGFTATNVTRALVQATALSSSSVDCEHEQVVLVLNQNDEREAPADKKSSSRPFDFGALSGNNQSNKWTWARIFGNEQKTHAVKKGTVNGLD